jgi:hypothetical protein
MIQLSTPRCKMVAPEGLEPPTCGLGNRRSILLSYESILHKYYRIKTLPCQSFSLPAPQVIYAIHSIPLYCPGVIPSYFLNMRMRALLL